MRSLHVGQHVGSSCVRACVRWWLLHVTEPVLVRLPCLPACLAVCVLLRSRPAIVSTAEFEADKQSLLRMLDEFQRDHPEALQAAVPAPAAAPAAGPAGTTELATAAAAAPPAAAASSADQLDVDAVNRGMQVRCDCRNGMHCMRSGVCVQHASRW